MINYHFEIEQRSQEWFDLKLGKVSASRVADIMTSGRKKDDKFGLTAISYADELIAQTMTGQFDNISNTAMQWGTDNEPLAVEQYEIKTFSKVVECGWVEDNQYPIAGVSPDGLVDDDGLIEVKCPFTSKNHVNHIINGCPKNYYTQIQFQLFISQRKWCDFVSYDPRVKSEMSLFIERIEPDEDMHNKFKERLKDFTELLMERNNIIIEKYESKGSK